VFRHVLVIVIILLAIIPRVVVAGNHTPTPDTGNAELDSILIVLHNKYNVTNDSLIDRVKARVYVKGNSRGVKEGLVSTYFYNILPFEGRTDHMTTLESLCEVNYKNPGQLQILPISVRSFGRNGYKILKESFQAMLPVYTFRRMKERGNNKSFVTPISKEGLEQYKFSYAIADFTLNNEKKQYIYFEPIHKHHTLGSGYILIDKDCNIEAMLYSGRIDFGKVDCYMNFAIDKETNRMVPVNNHIRISYNYAGSRAVNNYDCYFDFLELEFQHKKNKSKDKLDLTEIYAPTKEGINLDSIRPVPLTHEEDSLLSIGEVKRHRKFSFFKRLPELLVSTNSFDFSGSNYRIYGPLEPSTFGYDKLNGITLRQRFHFQRETKTNKQIQVKTDLGYSFKSKDFRYRFLCEWIYNPSRLGTFRIDANNRSSDFPGRYRDAVNYVLKDTTGITYEDLGIRYYHTHEIKIEHSSELCNGLQLIAGIGYNYRISQKRSSTFKIPSELERFLHRNYADFSPYVRLTWTPRQYYYYIGRRKEYIASNYPTITFEYTNGIKDVLGSTSHYGRIEFDVLQILKIDELRTLSFHGGAGGFFDLEGEYFINYNFFNRSLIPSAWEEHIGGRFNLLEDHWYNSSPAYIQAHMTYESPFLLLHQIGLISKYVIKERIYSSMLWSKGKNAYSELGYGIGNNYFSLGVFTSFSGFHYREVGFKFRLEIDAHI